MAACEGGRVEVVRSLMEKAATLGKLEEMCNKTDAAGKTPFEMAAAGQHKVRLLIQSCTSCQANGTVCGRFHSGRQTLQNG